MAEKYTAVGCHIFAGGFTLGVKRAGFDVVAHLERGPYGVASSFRNHPEVTHCVDKASWPTGPRQLSRPDLVYGNPPCAPWSSAGNRGSGKDGRAICVIDFLELAEIWRPQVVLFESVQRILTTGKDFLDTSVIPRFHELGYSVTLVKHNVYDCGAPQSRRRVFVVASRLEIPWKRPHRGRAPKTVREAWDGLVDEPRECANVGPIFLEALEVTAEGGKLRDSYDELFGETLGLNSRGKKVGRPGFLHRRLRWDAPSPTHTGGPVIYHPDEPRLISIREAQVLGGYPPDYEFVAGGMNPRYQQVSQAVLPPAGRWIASNVLAALEQGVHVRKLAVELQGFEV